MSQQEINDNFNLERKKHFDFYLPFYQEKNWQVIEDNINSAHKNPWDVKLEVFGGQYVLVDEKVRTIDYGDCLVEMIQDIKTGTLGWYFGSKDWVLYGSWDNLESVYPKSLYLIKMAELENYINGISGRVETRISKKGWGNTWNIVLNWNDLIKNNIAERLI